MKAIKKIVALTLVLIMAVSVMNISAFAEGGFFVASSDPAPIVKDAKVNDNSAKDDDSDADGEDKKETKKEDESAPAASVSLSKLADVDLSDLDWNADLSASEEEEPAEEPEEVEDEGDSDSTPLPNPPILMMALPPISNTVLFGIFYVDTNDEVKAEYYGTSASDLITKAAAISADRIIVLNGDVTINDTLVIGNDARLAGMGYKITFAGADDTAAAVSSADDLVIDNLTIDCGSKAKTGISVTGTDALIRNVTVNNAKLSGVDSSSDNLQVKGLTVDSKPERGIHVSGGAINVTNAVIDGKVNSIDADGTSEVTISAGTFKKPVTSETSVVWKISGGTFKVEDTDTDASSFKNTYLDTGKYDVKKNSSMWDVVSKEADPYVASIGSVKYTDLQTALDNAKPGETVKILKNIDAASSECNVPITKGNAINLDLNGKSVKLAKLNVYGDLNIKGAEGSKLDTVVDMVDEADVNVLTVSDKVEITEVDMQAASTLKCSSATVNIGTVDSKSDEDVTINISAGKFGTLKGTVVSTVTGGIYKNEPDDGFAATGYVVAHNTGSDKATYPWIVEKAVDPSASFTTPSGATYMEYYKKNPDTANANAYAISYKSDLVDSNPIKLYFRDKSKTPITLTNYSIENKVISIVPANSKTEFNQLEPGLNYIGLEFVNQDNKGNNIIIYKPVYVWPDNEIDKEGDTDYRHYEQGVDTGVTLLLNSDPMTDYTTWTGSLLPVYYSSSSKGADLKEIPSSYLLEGDPNKITIDSTFLDKLNGGTYYLYLKLGTTTEGGAYDIISPAYKFDVVTKANASFNENLTDGNSTTWSTSTGNLKVYANAPIAALEMDGKALVLGDEYTLSTDKKTATILSSFLKNKSHEKHDLKVTTEHGGSETLEIRVAPNLEAVKDVTKHTQGSSYTLAYRCSQPVESVFLTGKFGGTSVVTKEVPTDKYALSGDKQTVTFSAAYLNSIGVGSYSVRVSTTEKDPVTGENIMSNYAPLGIITTGTAGTTPRTGDGANFGLWISLMIMSVLGMGTVAVSSKKKLFGRK